MVIDYQGLDTLEDWNRLIASVRELLNEMGLEVINEEENVPHNILYESVPFNTFDMRYTFYLVYQNCYSCMWVHSCRYKKYPKYYFKPFYSDERKLPRQSVVYMAVCSNTNDISKLEQELRRIHGRMMSGLLDGLLD